MENEDYARLDCARLDCQAARHTERGVLLDLALLADSGDCRRINNEGLIGLAAKAGRNRRRPLHGLDADGRRLALVVLVPLGPAWGPDVLKPPSAGWQMPGISWQTLSASVLYNLTVERYDYGLDVHRQRQIRIQSCDAVP